MTEYEHYNFKDIPRGKNYVPALKVQSVSSEGLSARIAGIKTGRQHDLLSLNEQRYFYILEFSDFVVDIREQFPMNIEKTMMIARELGINHPYDREKNEPYLMTTDFCITIQKDGLIYDIVRTVKPSEELMQLRKIEKFEIERVYWEREKIDWGIVTELEIDKTLAKNILNFRGAYSLEDIPELMELNYEELSSYKAELARRLVCAEISTIKAIRYFARDNHLSASTCITLFNHLIATKVLRMNLRDKLDLSKINNMSLDHKMMDELLKAE